MDHSAILELNFEILQDVIRDYSNSYSPKLIPDGSCFKFSFEDNVRVFDTLPKEIADRCRYNVRQGLSFSHAVYCKVSKKITTKKEVLYYIVYQLRYSDTSVASYAIAYEIDQMLYSYLKLLAS